MEVGEKCSTAVHDRDCCAFSGRIILLYSYMDGKKDRWIDDSLVVRLVHGLVDEKNRQSVRL